MPRCQPSAGYPSTEQPLAALAEGVARDIQQQVEPGGAVFLVTHSMGAVVWRIILGLSIDIVWAGAVLLGPPNNGSCLARMLGQVKSWRSCR